MQKVDRLGWAVGFSVRVYGVKIGIRSNRSEWLDQIWRHLPHGCKVIPSGVVDRVYSIIIGGEGAHQARAVQTFFMPITSAWPVP